MSKDCLGPIDPTRPVGDKVVIAGDISGAHIVRQEYADGFLYQLQAPRGTSCSYGADLLGLVPGGVLVDVFDPSLIDPEDENLYLTVWLTRPSA